MNIEYVRPLQIYQKDMEKQNVILHFIKIIGEK